MVVETRPMFMRSILAGMLLFGVVTAAFGADDGNERPPLITAETEAAIQRGMKYLANTQSSDGSWQAGAGWGGGYPTAMTSLAGLALLAGRKHAYGRGVFTERLAGDRPFAANGQPKPRFRGHRQHASRAKLHARARLRDAVFGRGLRHGAG